MSGLISPILPGIQSRGLLYTSPLKADFAAPQKTSIKELPQATQTLGPAERMSAGSKRPRLMAQAQQALDIAELLISGTRATLAQRTRNEEFQFRGIGLSLNAVA